MGTLFDPYDSTSFFDEAFDGSGTPRDHYAAVLAGLDAMGAAELRRRQELRDVMQRSRGVTFTVYAEGSEAERTFPLDLVPRIVPAAEWAALEAGLKQRIAALNTFLQDVYSSQQIVKDGIVPRWMIVSSPQFQRRAWGISPPGGVYIHVAGPDLVRGEDGRWMVLEDNLRTPSGASYVIENREVLTRVVPELFGSAAVRPVDHYPALLRDALRQAAPPEAGDDPTIVLLTPGIYNSAYFEHTLLARHMGIRLVEGGDLFADGDVVYMRTTEGRLRVDVVYRRVDDEFLDPLAFRPDSMLGCTGIFGAARAGNVTLANAIGNGVADDKAMFAFVPEMIRYYLGEEPLLDNVPTYVCADNDQLAVVLSRLERLVVKPVDASGGYGMLIGPSADERTIERFRREIARRPRSYIAQEVVGLSRHPTFEADRCSPRHIDLRPFIVQGERIEVLPGGLTRVALQEGSLVVNSSQGGGSKDTWVLRDAARERAPARSADGRPARVARGLPMRPGAPESGTQQPQQQQQQGAAPC